MTFEITTKTASPAPRLTKIKLFAQAEVRWLSARMWGMSTRARTCIARRVHVTRAREFEMSSRAPVSSHPIQFSSRGSHIARAPASVECSVIFVIDLPSYNMGAWQHRRFHFLIRSSRLWLNFDRFRFKIEIVTPLLVIVNHARNILATMLATCLLC